MIAGGALDYWPVDRPDLDQGRPADWRVEADWPEGLFATVRAVVVHAILDTANHAGHLDAARELIDGHQNLVL